MTLRTGHGRGAGVPRVEVLPADELPAGVPAHARPEATRDEAGRFVAGPGTSELARCGAVAAHEARQLAQLLGLWQPPAEHAYAPYARLGREWRDAHMAQLSATVGGGAVGPGPASIVSTAALQLGASRYLADVGAQTGDAKLLLDASRLADSSRQNLLAAHELCAREAAARPRETTTDALRRRIAALGVAEQERGK
ncbi:MAG: hypothetical protein QM756_26580 [Polyangiaceae bacterium]